MTALLILQKHNRILKQSLNKIYCISVVIALNTRYKFPCKTNNKHLNTLLITKRNILSSKLKILNNQHVRKGQQTFW